jgi:flotillin
METIIGSAIVLLGTFFAIGVAGILLAKKLIYIAAPNEVLVFSGRGGYRTIKGGRGYRFPLIETVDRMDLTNMIIDVAVQNAYAKGGIPLTVQGVANIKVAGHQPLLGNAIQRFMGKERRAIIKIAKDTLEGNLRGVLSQLTPEQVNDDKLQFAEKLLEEAEHDLSKLGLVLDTMKVQHVEDDVGYLDSIGRQRTAEVIKQARVAEAEAKAESTQKDAANNQTARIRDVQAEMAILEANTSRRVREAETAREAMIAEEIGEVHALIEEAKEDIGVQESRVEQVRRQLQADVTAPAEAHFKKQQAEAQGRAAKIIEDGRATVMVLNEMIITWKQGGDSARDIFLMQKLQGVMGSLVDTIDEVKIDRMTLLPGNSDSTAQRAVTLVEELKAGVGVDVPKLLERVTGGPSDG